MFVKNITFLSLFICSSTFALQIDNGVEGEPEVECQPQGISVLFNVKNPFNGYVFVKGVFSDPACQSREAGTEGDRAAGLTVPLDGCNTLRTRSLNPRGVYVSTTVIISFHEKFITTVDRAYRVQCFYMEADKTVSQDLDVSMLTTGVQTEVVQMPSCRYEILDGGPSGGPVSSVMVGQKVFHKWTCDTESENIFCMNVHSCYVDDGQGDRVDLLDQQGCGVDRYLLQNLEYLTDLMAGQESMVFKYADRPQLFFRCQIAITIKEDVTCARSPCSPLLRGKRSAMRPPTRLQYDVVDVTAQLSSMDLDDRLPAHLPDETTSSIEQRCGEIIFIPVLLAVISLVFLMLVAFFCKIRRTKADSV